MHRTDNEASKKEHGVRIKIFNRIIACQYVLT